MEKEFWGAVWTLISVIVGAGILGIPFVLYKSGFLTGLVVIILIGLVMLLINLYLGEIILRTKGRYHIGGLANIYLGKYGQYFVFAFYALTIYGALIAYVLGAGQALQAIFNYGDIFYYSLGFFAVFSVLIFFSLNIFESSESILNPIKIGILIILSVLMMPKINLSNLINFDARNFLVPYGVIVFAFTGMAMIPEMARELKNKINLKKSIICAILITIFIYILFSFSIIGVMNDKVTEVATISLNQLGFKFGLLGNLFALFAMSTAFIGLGFSLKEAFVFDYKLKNWQGWLLVVVLPLILLLSKFGNFIFFLEISGAVGIGILLASILIMHSRSKKLGNRKPEFELKDNSYLKTILFILIIVGIVYTLYGFIF